MAQQLANRAPIGLGHMKRLIRQAHHCDFSTQLDAERDAFCASAATHDFAQALEAFFARRSPHFIGD